MSAQQQLVKIAPTVLRIPQQTAWDLIRNTPGGCYADEIGAAVHAASGRHSVNERCDFCAIRGKELCRSKALVALVVRRRATGKYEPRNPADRAHEPMGVIPF